MINYSLTKTREELQQILDLQQQNLAKSLSPQEIKEQGFVTLEHDLDLLASMHDACPHVIAKDSATVVGYALTMLPSFKNEMPALSDMFEQIEELDYQNRKLRDVPYFVMGQVCIHKDYRSQGIFSKLYDHLRLAMQDRYELTLTEVSPLNTRSVRAHEKVGFKLLRSHEDEHGKFWNLIAWDWS